MYSFSAIYEQATLAVSLSCSICWLNLALSKITFFQTLKNLSILPKTWLYFFLSSLLMLADARSSSAFPTKDVCNKGADLLLLTFTCPTGCYTKVHAQSTFSTWPLVGIVEIIVRGGL